MSKLISLLPNEYFVPLWILPEKILKEKAPTILLVSALYSMVGMTRFERATTRPPDVYSNRAELHPEIGCENTTIIYYFQVLF